MTAVMRAWLGFIALGAGLIHLALVIGSPLHVGIPLLVVGAAEFGWGVFAFATPVLVVPRVARIAALTPILGWVVVLVLSGSGAVAVGGIAGLRVLPMLVASLLDLGVAIGTTAVLRRAGRPDPALRPGRYLIALGVGALVVAALTMPALAATEAGEAALPGGGSGEPSDVDPPGLHGH